MFKAVEIEISTKCNLACSYCPNSLDISVEQRVMDLDLFKKIISQLADIQFNGRVSYHFYNEPLLNENLESYVKLVREYLPDCKNEVSTNGVLLTLQRYVSLKQAGVDKFNITKHEQTKKIPFDDVYQELDSDEKKWVNYINHLELCKTNRGGSFSNTDFKSKNLPCHIPGTTMVITCDGDILPCYEDYYKINKMGNINDSHVSVLWNSEKYINFRSLVAKGRREENSVCVKCNNYRIF
jgi:radical SAM protein with 4Fe4S-binding SPASM domain